MSDLKRKSIPFVAIIAILALVLAACSTGAQNGRTADGPELELYLLTDGAPRRVTSGALVGSSPAFELRVVDREPVASVEYRIDAGSWQDLSGYGFHRLNFVPGVQFTGTAARLDLRATSLSGASSEQSFDFRVDSQDPEISLLEVTPTVPADASPITAATVDIHAQAVDEGAGSGNLALVLELNGELIHSAVGGVFDYTIQTVVLPAGIHRFQLSAVDGAGNRSAAQVIPVRGGI